MLDLHLHNTEPAALATCMTVSHLQWLGDDPATAEVIYLGYPLLLSASERRILFCFLHALDEGEPCVSSEVLAAALPASDRASTEDATADRAAQVHVYLRRINQKAEDIGGRKLILRDRHRGYRLNLNM